MAKPMFKIGDKVKIASDNDNDNYNKFRGKTLIITNVATNKEQHRGYDSSMEGMALYDFKGVPFSLYEYELEPKYAKGSTVKGGMAKNGATIKTNKMKYKTLQEKISKEAGFKFWGYSSNQYFFGHIKFEKASLNDMVNYLNETYGDFTEKVYDETKPVKSMVWVIKPKDIDFEEEIFDNKIYIQAQNKQRQFYLTWMVKERLVDKIAKNGANIGGGVSGFEYSIGGL